MKKPKPKKRRTKAEIAREMVKKHIVPAVGDGDWNHQIEHAIFAALRAYEREIKRRKS